MHSCPECGQACYCGGDVDDIEADPSAANRCTHCDGSEPDEPDEPMNEPARDKARDPQPGDVVNGRTVTRRNDTWVEYSTTRGVFTVRLEVWTRCVCSESA